MSTKVVTGKVRFSYPYLFEAQEPLGGGDPKYSITLLIPKTDTTTISKITAAIAEAREAYCKKNGATALPPKPATTIHDGDGQKSDGTDFGPECAGCYVIKVKSKQRPVVVDYAGNPITDEAEVYGGCYGRASINFYGYNTAGQKGVSAALLAVQKLCDGEPFGTIGSADDFNDGFSAGGAGDLDDLLG